MNGPCKDFRTEHFLVLGSQIETWNKDKIDLPEGAGHKYIAPSDLTATLLKPFNCEERGLIYGQEWVGKEIGHFPFCEELLLINKYLQQHGWHIPVSWEPIVNSLSDQIKKAIGEPPSSALKAFALQNRFNLRFSGYVWKSDLKHVGGNGCFWSASERSAYDAWYLSFDSDDVYPEYGVYCGDANSVRCVS